MNTDNKPVSQNRVKKEAIVAEVKEKVDKAKAMVFANYQGLTHQQLESFKKEIRKADAEFAATKNTLLKRALGEENVAGNEDYFNGPTGTIFMYGDIVSPLKTLTKLMKELEKPTIKFGLLDGKAITEADVKKLATLPAKEVLIAQMLSLMVSPIQGFHRALSWNLQKFVMTLSAVAKKKETEPQAAPAVEKVAEAKPEVVEAAAETPAQAASAESSSEPKEEAPAQETPTETSEEPKA